MKKLFIFGIAGVCVPFVAAEYSCSGAYGMMGGFGNSLFAVLWFTLAAIIFSVIFWGTKRYFSQSLGVVQNESKNNLQKGKMLRR